MTKANLQLNRAKCCFRVPEVDFPCHKIDAKGGHQTEDKVRAIVEAPAQTSKLRLQSFLGMLAFNNRFLGRRAIVAAEINKLLQKDTQWRLGERHQKASDELKQLILKRTIIAYCNENKPLLMFFVTPHPIVWVQCFLSKTV